VRSAWPNETTPTVQALQPFRVLQAEGSSCGDHIPSPPKPPAAISSELSLEDRVRHWISKHASEEVADRFYPWVQETLQDLGCDPEEPVSEATFHDVVAALREADIDPSRMEHALREARRAQEEDLSTLQWIREVQSRAFTDEMAQKSFERAHRRLSASDDDPEDSLHSPPSAEQIFVFFLIWEEMGGTSTFATIREAHRREEGSPPSN